MWSSDPAVIRLAGPRRTTTARPALVLSIAAGAVAAGLTIRRVSPFARGLADLARPVRTSVAIRASAERTWVILADLPAQPRWMRDLKDVRIVTPGPVGTGTRAVGTVRIFGLRVEDPIEILAWEPPRRFGLRHLGRFRGHGEIRLSSLPDGVTIVEWEEVLVAPVLPHLVGLVARPVFRRVFAADLRRLRDLVEGGGTTEAGEMGEPGRLASDAISAQRQGT